MDYSSSPFGTQFDLRELCWSVAHHDRLEPAVNELSTKIEILLFSATAEQTVRREVLWKEISEIWIRRRELLMRIGVVVGIVALLGFGLTMAAPDSSSTPLQIVRDNWKEVVLGLVGTVIVGANSFVLVGPKSRLLRKAFQMEIRPIVNYLRKTKEAKNKYELEKELLFSSLEFDMQRRPLDFVTRLHDIVGSWFKQSVVCTPLKRIGDQIQTLYTDRQQAFTKTKTAIVAAMTKLSTDGSAIANQKRRESVETMLASITDKRNSIISFRDGLGESLTRLA